MIVRQGTLEPSARVAVDFGLLGPNRRVQLDGTLVGVGASQGRVAVSCGSTFRARALPGTGSTSLVVQRLGPGECEASIVNTGTRPGRFRFTVRLGLQG